MASPSRLTIRCRGCEFVATLAEPLDLYADSTWYLPPGIKVDAVRWVENDRVEVSGLCTTCDHGPKILSLGPKAYIMRAGDIMRSKRSTMNMFEHQVGREDRDGYQHCTRCGTLLAAPGFTKWQDGVALIRQQMGRNVFWTLGDHETTAPHCEPVDHATHGRGQPETGPDDPDCPCRGTGLQRRCAQAGCGFCRCELEGDVMVVDRQEGR